LRTLNKGAIVFLGQISRFRRNSAGNVAITFAAALLPLLGAIGASVDYSLANAERTKTQSVLDSAVLAGVQEATTSLRIAKAQAFFDGQITNPWGSKPTASFSVDSSGRLTGVFCRASSSSGLRVCRSCGWEVVAGAGCC
jgi:Flp pilus assembly protein TadG